MKGKKCPIQRFAVGKWDTSWHTRYRSTENPDFGDTFTGPVKIINRPAIPLNDKDTPPNQIPPSTHMQAIANTAGFHFPTTEQGGSSLYGSLIPMATSLVVLRILYAIGGSEVAHFQTWHDKAVQAGIDISNQTSKSIASFAPSGDDRRDTGSNDDQI